MKKMFDHAHRVWRQVHIHRYGARFWGCSAGFWRHGAVQISFRSTVFWCGNQTYWNFKKNVLGVAPHQKVKQVITEVREKEVDLDPAGL